MSFENLMRDGIPDRLFTRTNAIAAALAGVTILFFVSTIYNKISAKFTSPPPVPECFDAENPVTDTPTMNAFKAGEQNFGPYTQRGKSFDIQILNVTEAQKKCLPESCDSNANQEYRSAIFWYLSDRTRHIKKMQNLAGAGGLADAINFYRRPIDREIDQGLRDRYNAKLVDLGARSWTQMGEALPIIIFRGGDALKACGRMD